MLTASALAHDADVIYVLAESSGPQLVETVTLTVATLGQLAPIDANGDGEITQPDLDARADSIRAGVWEQMPLSPCTREHTETARLREGFIELTAHYTCNEGELRQNYRFLSVLPTNYRIVLGSQFDGETSRSFAQGTLTSLNIPRASPRLLHEGRLQDGFARCFTLDVLACVILALITAKSWRIAAGALLLGTLSSVGSAPPLLSTVLLAASAVAWVLLRNHPRVDGVALLTGVAIGLRSGAPGLEGLVGTVLALLLIGAPSMLIGRMLKRRPAWHLRAQVALLVCVTFSLGFRVMA